MLFRSRRQRQHGRSASARSTPAMNSGSQSSRNCRLIEPTCTDSAGVASSVRTGNTLTSPRPPPARRDLYRWYFSAASVTPCCFATTVSGPCDFSATATIAGQFLLTRRAITREHRRPGPSREGRPYLDGYGISGNTARVTQPRRRYPEYGATRRVDKLKRVGNQPQPSDPRT